jgi:hypothetical protein
VPVGTVVWQFRHIGELGLATELPMVVVTAGVFVTGLMTDPVLVPELTIGVVMDAVLPIAVLTAAGAATVLLVPGPFGP